MNPFLKWLDEHCIGIFATFCLLPILYPLFLGILVLLENFFNILFLSEIINYLSTFLPKHNHGIVLYYFFVILLSFLIGHIVDMHKKNLEIKKLHLSTTSDFYLLRFFIDKKKQISKIMETENDKNRLIMLRVLSQHLESNIENIIESGACYNLKSDSYFEYRWNREKNKYTKFNVCWDFIREETKKETDEQCSRALEHHKYLGKIHLEQDLIEPDSDEELLQWEIDELNLTDSQLEYFFFRLPIDDDLLKLYYDAVFLTEARCIKEKITGFSTKDFEIYDSSYTLLENLKKSVIKENDIK